MILKVRMNEEMKEHISVIKKCFFDEQDKVTTGDIIGLAVEHLSERSDLDLCKALEDFSFRKASSEAKSTSISLRQEIYDRLLYIQNVLQDTYRTKLYMSQVIGLILERGAAKIQNTSASGSLKIMEWNVNGRTGFWDYSVPVKLIADEVFKQEPDIFVLTEFVKTNGWCDLRSILEENYHIFTSRYVPGENSILMGIVKKQGVLVTEESASKDWDCSQRDVPNFLEKEIIANGVKCRIIGTRILVDTKKNKTQGDYDADFRSRSRQFDHLWSYVESLKGNTIVMGDFNHGVTNCEDNKEYTYKDGSRKYFNYQHIWRRVEASGQWELITPHRGRREKFSYIAKNNCEIKQDHFIKSKGIAVESADYSWKFVSKSNGYGLLKAEDYKSDLVGLPDHAVLTAEISLGLL